MGVRGTVGRSVERAGLAARGRWPRGRRLLRLGALEQLGLGLVALAVLVGAGAAQPGAPTWEELRRAIGQLGDFDFATRTRAARLLRRAPIEETVPLLIEAVTRHDDSFVQYRAFVLLTGVAERRVREVLAHALESPNDRLREVAYKFLERQPEPSLTGRLLAALEREQSEFVRPALVRALAARGGEARVREALVVEAGRGEDFFRSAVIEALGNHQARYAVPTLIRLAQQDGPLQDDAVLALGRVGDSRALETLAELQRRGPRELQPTVAAAICLLGVSCDLQLRYLVDTLRFAVAVPGVQPLLRATAAALAAVAVAGRPEALEALLDSGVTATDPVRAPLALAVGTVALRNPSLALAALARRTDRRETALLLRDAFDMLDEDFEEEQFFAEVRRVYWAAPTGSAERAVAELLVELLEF